ncbi:MAG: hypothetical protein PVG12_05905 [Gammaproteobacteria bacterium]|jgi:hypothetical protein
MNNKKPIPGVSRPGRLSNEGLSRLENQLKAGVNVSPMVLAQWIKRYGEPAVAIIKKYQGDKPEPD